MSRTPNPTPDPIVGRLLKQERPGETDAEDVLALVGFVGPGRQDGRRIHPDRHLQRWLELPDGAIVDSQRIDSEDELSRSVVWVRRSVMTEPVLQADVDDGLFDQVLELLDSAPFSAWNLLPETRMVAARLLGLIPYGDEPEQTGEGGYPG